MPLGTIAILSVSVSVSASVSLIVNAPLQRAVSLPSFYRPQTKFAKVMFLQASVILLTGGGVRGFIRGACVVLFGGMRGFIWGGVRGFIRGVRGFIWGGCGVRGFIWGACVVLFGGGMHGFIWGVCVVLFGGHAWFYLGGHAWFYSGGHVWFYSGGSVHGFIWGGMRGFIRGACVVLFGGHAWFYSGGRACMVFPVFSDTMRYGQWAGGTHPTGMHSCFLCAWASAIKYKTPEFCSGSILLKGM